MTRDLKKENPIQKLCNRLGYESRMIQYRLILRPKIKETHCHPTSVVPYEGAATGSGGEIRDEGAVGRGSKSKAGLCGFSVSDLLIPKMAQPWELDVG